MSGRLTFDLVVATIGRTEELARLLETLAAQSSRDFRVILIDQNDDGRLEPIIERYRDDIDLIHLSSKPGLSRARNVGLRSLQADVIAFPDDDCWYPPDLLGRVADFLGRNPSLDGVVGRTIDQASRSSFLLWQKDPSPVTRANVWRTAVAVTIFCRRAVIERVGLFDETLGAGSGTSWGSGEETDYVLRALAAGFTIGYDPTLGVFHESPNPTSEPASARKGYFIGMGNSLVLRRHGFPPWFALYRVLQLVAGSAFFLVSGRFGHARFYWAMARGRAAGWVRAAQG
jgi:glycosyltransferase involved in cell wall biosynthesis